jgi:hypothetical protein
MCLIKVNIIVLSTIQALNNKRGGNVTLLKNPLCEVANCEGFTDFSPCERYYKICFYTTIEVYIYSLCDKRPRSHG